MKKLIAILLALVMVLALFAGCAPKAEAPVDDAPAKEEPKDEPAKEEPKDEPAGEAEPVKIGLIAPMTGAAATNGTALAWTAQWVADYINENGGIENLGGAKVEIVVGDSQGNADIGLSEYERLVNNEKVAAITGIYNSPVAMALAPRAIADKVPMVVSNATTDAIYNTANDYVYHANLTANVWLKGNADHFKVLHEASGKDEFKIAFVYEAGNYGQSDFQTMYDNMAAIGIDDIVDISIDANAADFAAVVAQLKKLEDELTFVMPAMSENNATLFTRQMKEYNCNVPIVSDGGGFYDGVYIQNNPTDSEYILSTANYPMALAGASFDPDLALGIMAEFEEELGFPWIEAASLYWMNLWTLIDALDRAESASRDDIAAALKATDIKDADDHMAELLGASKDICFETVELFGVTVYNQNPNCSNFLCQIKDGVYEVVSPAAYATTDLVFPTPAWNEK